MARSGKGEAESPKVGPHNLFRINARNDELSRRCGCFARAFERARQENRGKAPIRLEQPARSSLVTN